MNIYIFSVQIFKKALEENIQTYRLYMFITENENAQ